jgi:hypothetical protein
MKPTVWSSLLSVNVYVESRNVIATTTYDRFNELVTAAILEAVEASIPRPPVEVGKGPSLRFGAAT